MIPVAAASTAISIAKGLVRLTGRVDGVLAERAAVTADLVAAMPKVGEALSTAQLREALREALERTAGTTPDPFGDGRDDVQAAVANTGSTASELRLRYNAHLGIESVRPPLDPDSEFVRLVREEHGDWNLDDPDRALAAFALAAGKDDRQRGYTWRVALTVVDVAAEFGAENAVLITHDRKLQPIVAAVLRRFADADVQTADSWNALLQKALSATLNAALDARASLGDDTQWLEAALDALAEVREQQGGDPEFVLGLVRGRGYPALVAALLGKAAQRLDGSHAPAFQKIAADVLLAAAAQMKDTPDFRGFFQDRWGDLMNAGIESLAREAPAMLRGQDPLLRETLVAMTRQFAAIPSSRKLDGDTVFALADAALAAVAAKPELVTGDVDEPWLKELIQSTLVVASSAGVRDTFGSDGAARILRGALARFGEHPELLVEDAGLAQGIVGSVLTAVASAKGADARVLGEAAVAGALDAVAANPALIGLKHGELVAAFAGNLSGMVGEGGLSRIEARGVLAAGLDAVAENPALFLTVERGLAVAVVEMIVERARADPNGLVAGATLVVVAREVLNGLAKRGAAAVESTPLRKLVPKVGKALDAGLARADAVLGEQIGMSAVPGALAGVVLAVVRGELKTLDPKSKVFQAAFDEIVGAAA